MRAKPLSDEGIDKLLLAIPQWHINDKRTAISIQLTFSNFQQAFACMTEIALASEAIDHHPEWTNSYRRLIIKLTTHDVGGLTILDQTLATAITNAARRHGAIMDMATDMGGA